MPSEPVFHVSEQGGIEIFQPRASPSFYPAIDQKVVFAISKRMLHNYLLPRDCPRIGYYAGHATTDADKERFLTSEATCVLVVESGWMDRIQTTTLYCYEFQGDHFRLLDECAGYLISETPNWPVSIRKIDNPLRELLKIRALEIRMQPDLRKTEQLVRNSTLNYSIIRMRNAQTP